MNPEGQTTDQRRIVLEMVRSLHQRGYGLLRVMPMMAPSGLYWRCAIGPRSLCSVHHGALLRDNEYFNPLVVHYSNAMGAQYFDWPALDDATPEQLADLFVERREDIVSAARGADDAYVDWYEQMIERTDPHFLPDAMADWEYREDRLATVSLFGEETPDLPLPPPGGLADRVD